MPELQPLRAEHAPAVLAFERANRAYFTAFVSDRGDDYFQHFADRHAALLAEQASGTGAYYLLVADDGSVLGRFNLTLAGDGVATLGYRVAERAAGQGVATAGVREICRLAAQRHGVRTLRAATSHANVASQRVLRKAGFVPAGPAKPSDLGGKAGFWWERQVGSVAPAGGAPWGQEGYGVRFAWGPAGAAHVGAEHGVLVIVDVLSFTTSVTVAAGRGVAVYPAEWRDARAGALAQRLDAVLAVGRREVTAEHPWSLSPAALLRAPAPPRLVLPSPNGSAIAAAAPGVVVAACLRNASAVAAWLSGRAGTPDHPVTVVAAGERWPDGSLRPALEDLLGAGAVLAALGARDRSVVSPESAAAVAAFRGTESVPDAVRRCASGIELASGGFGDDVEVAVQPDADAVVPVRTGGAFQAA